MKIKTLIIALLLSIAGNAQEAPQPIQAKVRIVEVTPKGWLVQTVKTVEEVQNKTVVEEQERNPRLTLNQKRKLGRDYKKPEPKLVAKNVKETVQTEVLSPIKHFIRVEEKAVRQSKRVGFTIDGKFLRDGTESHLGNTYSAFKFHEETKE